MELRLFGPGKSPNNRFLAATKLLMQLNPSQLDEFDHWFHTTHSFDIDAAPASETILNSTLLPHEVAECVEVIKYMLEASHRRHLTVPDIEHDLLFLHYSEDTVKRVSRFLQKINDVAERVFRAQVRAAQEELILPLLDDINIVCDLRPIFEDSAPDEALGTRRFGGRTRLLGFTHLVLMEISSRDSIGRKQRLSVQMTESQFEELEAAIQRTRQQFAALLSNAPVLERHSA